MIPPLPHSPQTRLMLACLASRGTPHSEADALEALNAGADPNGTFPDGWTPLGRAIGLDATSTAKLLLSRGANPDERCGEKLDSPVYLACLYGRPEALALLLKSGASPDSCRYGGFSPLMLCLLQSGHKPYAQCARILLDEGASPFSTESKGFCPSALLHTPANPLGPEFSPRIQALADEKALSDLCPAGKTNRHPSL